jgi:YbbR domain-containing protein
MRRWIAAARRWAGVVPGHAGLGLLSLAIAVVIWVMVTNSENPVFSQEIEVPVQGVNMPRDFGVSDISPEKVTVTLTGPRNALRDVRQDDVIARVDLSGLDDNSLGQDVVTVTRQVKAEVRGQQGRRVRADPVVSQAKVRLERLKSKQVSVTVKEVGVLPVGIQRESIGVEPTTATVTGAPGNIDAVDSVSADVKLDGQTVSFSQQANLEARDSAGRTIGGVTVQPATATVNVKVKPTLFPKQVAVVVNARGQPKTGYEVTSIRTDPPSVTVVGPLDLVNNLTGITVDVDIDGATSDVVRSVKLPLPQNVTTNQQNVVVTIGIQAVRAPGSIGVAPRVINLQQGLTANLTTPVVALSLSGPLADLAQLRTSDVSVTVDATGLGPGTYKLDPKVSVPSTLQVDATVPEKVEVVITRGGP